VARDAAVAATTTDAGAPVDRSKQARELMDQASNALKEGNFEAALAQVDDSLKLRKTARAYMVRAQALQRLDRIDAALESVDLAAEMSPTYAPVFDLRGRILWAVGRKDEARFAFEQFLALESDTARADAVRDLLRESP
nr:tetratricopeptide repeat protein [Deltaproteobacteria bacterium]